MPCPQCGYNPVIIENSRSRQFCECNGLVPQDDSVRIMQSILNEGERNLMDAIAPYDLDGIIEAAFLLRELTARKFTLCYTSLDLDNLIVTTALIKTLLQAPYPTGRRHAGTGEAMWLIRSYSTFLHARDNLHNLHAGTYNMIRMSEYNLDNLSGLRPADFPVYPNETYAPVIGTFAKHGIMTEAAAARKVREMRGDWKPVSLGSKKIASLDETISTFYSTGSMLHVAFAANRARRGFFSLPDGGSAPVSFFDLKKLIASIPAFPNGVTWRYARDFEQHARRQFGGRYAGFARNFVAGRGNPWAFPLFVRIKDMVLVSHLFGELYCYALLPVLHKREFDRETMTRGRSYEQTVQERFEKRGFKYFLNVKNGFEIDGIAVSDKIAYVVEAKSWASRPEIGDLGYSDIIERRIRGAIDGMEYKRAPQESKRAGVPLPYKVGWVRKERARFKIKEDARIEGLLAVNVAPPVQTYKCCRIEFVDDFGLV